MTFDTLNFFAMPNKYWLRTLYLLGTLFILGNLQAQVRFKVALLPDSSGYQVSLFSEIGPFPATAQNFVPSATVTLIAPTGQVVPSSLTSQSGFWSGPDTYINPVASLNTDYFVFTMNGTNSDIRFSPGAEVNLFTFLNSESCAGAVELMDNDNDPFRNQDPTVNIGNQISVFGLGEGNVYGGAYQPGSADCTGPPPCDLVLDSVSAVSYTHLTLPTIYSV